MEIKTLVYIGVFLITLSIALNVYLSWDKIKKLISHNKESKDFEIKVKDDLNKISRNITNDLNNSNLDKKNTEVKTAPLPSPTIKSESKNENNDIPINTSDIDKEIEKLNKELKKLVSDISNEEKNIDVTQIKSNKNDVNKTDNQKPDTDNTNKEKEVYLVKSNIFSKNDANKVCKALFNGDVATKSQIEIASNEGANWCNYGWADDNNGYYPLSEDTENSVCSGKKGINGGNFANSDNLKLGINCFGIKPEEKMYSSLDTIFNMDMFNEYERESLEKYKKNLNKGKIKLEPYNPNQWSKYSFKKDTITINNTTVITTSKTDKSKDPSNIKIEKNRVDSIIKTK
jgi:hypothetical protein